MSRPASAALTPLGDALGLIRACAGPVAARAVPLSAALGRVAAERVSAARPAPLRLEASRDGFAVTAEALGGASPYAPVPLTRPPAWVEAGAPLPAGTDAVLPPEGLEGGNVVADIAAREGTRGPGEDLAEGAELLRDGGRIRPLHLAALAGAGLETVAVRAPGLRLVATGAPAPDALAPLLAALIAARGGGAESRAVPHDPEAIAAASRDPGADAVLVLGGSGFGRSDRSADGLARAGRLMAHGIALRPGETAAIGEAGGRPVLVLPGRPEAGLAAFLALGAPLLARLAGAAETTPRPAPLLRKVASTIGLAEIVYLRRLPEGVDPLGGADLPLARLVQADGYALIAPEREGYPAGEAIEVWPL